MSNLLKKLFFWNYARSSWQWDVLCVLILVFIFLTPKSWFTNSERPGTQMHPKPSSTLLVGTEVVEKDEDKAQLQQRIRAITGRADAEVLEVRKVFASDGKSRGYEVDIK